MSTLVEKAILPISADAPTLVIDLDGTLCTIDTLHEGLIALAATRPHALFRLATKISKGKAELKRFVAEASPISPEGLPFDTAVLDLIKDARAEKRRVALVSATDQRNVDAIANHLELFDEAFGTNGEASPGRNLSGEAKAAFLASRYGDRGFDYLGDSKVDLPVWARARRALAVRPTQRLRKAALRAGVELEDIVPRPSFLERLKPYLEALRPHQWAKNLLILLPLLAAHDFTHLTEALIAIVAFCLTASSVYVVNDLVDLPKDRAHPRKCKRPFASGRASAAIGLLFAGGLFAAALAIAMALLPTAFTGVLLAYYAATFAYSLWLKQKLLVDVVTLAGLYTIRIVAGGVASGIALSSWMLAFSMFLFFSLAAIKRQAELTDQLKRNSTATTPGRAYSTDDLPVLRSMAVASGQASVLVLALYIESSRALPLYSRPEFIWLTCVVLFYWLSRMEVLTHRGFMKDDPIVFAAKDRISWICGLVVALTVIAAIV